MATTQAEAEVIERKLRPVYDAIDNGQNKKAAQMVDKILRKQEDLNCAKALKGIALMRMGRHDEGIGLIEGVMRTSPGDQATLQAVTMFFKETGDNKRIVALYATAAQHYPKNGEILTHLFMAYVRIGDYQKQQQTAASLHKVFPLNGPYYCWRIMSILMQAHEAGDDSTVATTMFLPLAEKLIEKYVSEKRIETEAEVKLYLMVLEKLGKTERRLEVVRGELAEKFRSRDEKNTVELECLLTLKLWDEAVKKLTELLQKTPDQWSFIAAYINSQIQRSLEARERGDDGEEEEEEEEREEEDEREGGGKEEGEQESGGQQDQEKELKNETMSCSSEAEGSSVETSSATKTSSGDSGATERTEREQPASEQERQSESGDGEQQKQPESGDGEQQKQSESGDGEQQKQPESGDGEQQKQPESGDGEQQKQSESGDGEQEKQPESGDGEQQKQPESGDGEQQKQPESGDGEQQKQPESGDGEQQEQPESGDGEQQKQPESGDGEQQEQPESGDGEQQKQPESGDGEQQQELKAGDTPSVGEANSGENTSESVEKAQRGEQSGCSETSTAPPASAVVWWVRPLVKAKSFLEKLTTKEKRKAGEQSARTHIVRGPFLGRMELVKQLTANGLAGHMELDTPVKLLMDYFCVFGTKSCVFEDLKTYLDVFPQEDIKEFLVKVEEKVNTEPIQFDCEDDKIKENMGRLRQHTSMVQLQRATGAHQDLSVAEVKELVAQCKHYYKEGLKLGRGLTPSVNQPADFYIIVASHLQMTLYQRTGNISLLWEAIFMLEYARKTNAQFSLLLMKLYAVLGVGEVMTDLYEGLYIKHLQMETLGYIPVRYLPAVGCFGLSDQLYRSGQRFYYNCSNEIAEYIIQAYKNGMFQKIVEFVELRERLAHSFNFSCMLVDMSLLELLTSVHSVQQGREFFQKESFSGLPYTSPNLEDYCSKLVDSRDLSVFDDWNPTCNRLSETDSEISFSLECLWLRTRVILLQCLQEATRLVLNNTAPSSGPSPTASSNSGKETTCNGGEVAASLSRRMKQFVRVLELLGEHRGVAMMKEARCRPLLGMSCGLLGPPSCLGFVFLEESHGRVLREMLSATEQVALGAPSIKERLKEILGTLQTTKSRISGIPGELREALMKLASSSHQGEADPSLQGPSHPFHLLSRTSVTVERYVLFLQTVNLLVLLSGMSAEIANPRVPGESKKKRKKKGASKNPVGEELVGFVKELKVLLLSVSQQFHPLPAVEGNLADLLSRTYIPRDVEEGPNFEQTVVPRTCKGVLESYNMSFRDCVEVVQSKVEFMNAIIKRLGGSLD